MNIKKRLLSMFLAVSLVVGSMSAYVFSEETGGGTTETYVDPVNKTADASTQDVWSSLMNSYQSTKYVGRIWTDKTVSGSGVTLEYKFNSDGTTTTPVLTTLTKAEDADFQVVLSAISSAQSVYGQREAYMDVMIILDISSSMYRSGGWDWSKLTPLIQSVNDTIENVQNLNPYNRVGVVLYYGGSGYTLTTQSTVAESGMVLLELGRYTNTNWSSETTNGKYVSLNTTARSVSSSTYLQKDGATYQVRSRSLTEIAGTYMQLGILYAMEQFLAVKTTTTAEGDTVEHTPVFILMSDGEPTASTSNFSKIENAEFGNNTVHSRNPEESDFVTQLTAAYAKAQVDIHYEETTPLFYTLSLGTSVSLAVMDPGNTISREGYTSDAPTVDENEVKGYWETLIANKSVTYYTYPHKLLTQTMSTHTTHTVELDDKNIFPTSIEQMQYVDKAYTAATADNLPDAFDDIYTEIVKHSAESPTYVESGNDASADGYVMLVDELGDYMELKSMDAITIEGMIYYYNENKSSETERVVDHGTYTETTYIFYNEVSLNTVLEARAGGTKVKENLNQIVIVERDYKDEASRDTLTVKIPASILPLRYYQVDAKGNLTIKETLPVRVVYSVGLLDSVRLALTTREYGSVSGLTNYVTSHTNTNGEIEFFSNYFDGVDSNGDGYTDGNSYSTFSPAQNNNFYYYTEDTTFYRLDKDQITYYPVESTGNYQQDLGGVVYYALTYYKYEDGTTSEVTEYIGLNVSAAIKTIGITWEEISNYIGVDKYGHYYMKTGNAKLSLANASEFIDIKEPNNTNTATTVVNPTWNSNAIGGQYDTYKTQNYLGNNGKITYAGFGNLAISKYVLAAAGLTPDSSEEFHFTIELSGTSGTFEAGETYEFKATHVERAKTTTDSTLTFTATASESGTVTATASATLKDLKILTIYGIPHGVVWKVTEELTEQQNHYKKSYSDDDTTGITDGTGTTTDGIGTIEAGKTDTVDVSNIYTVTSTSTNFQLSGNKTLEIKDGSNFTQDDLTFTFYLQKWSGNYEDDPENDGQWLYVTSEGMTTEAKSGGVTATATYSADTASYIINYDAVNAALAECEFTTVGHYFFRVVEENFGSTIDGIYYDGTVHSFIVTVKDDGDGALYVESVTCVHSADSTKNHWSSTTNEGETTWKNDEISFVNEYGTTKLSIDIDKTINDSTGGTYKKLEGYVFNWNYLGSYTQLPSSLDALTYEGVGASGKSTVTTADGIAHLTIEYDAGDDITDSRVDDKSGKHLYPSSYQKDNEGKYVTDADNNRIASKSTYYEYYEITEVKPQEEPVPNIEYSTQVYYVQVTVTVTGTDITADYSVVQYTNNRGVTYAYTGTDDGNHVWTQVDGMATIVRPEDDDLIFLNIYSDTVDVSLGVTKTLEGRHWMDSDEFSFTLTPIQFTLDDGTVLGTKFYLTGNDGTYTAVAGTGDSTTPTVETTSEAIVSFGNIVFTQVGTYYFTVTEDSGNLGGITYDNNTYSVRVVVTTNTSHELVAAVSTYIDGTITSVDDNNKVYVVAGFTNTYEAEPVEVILEGTKTLSGRDMVENEFSFTLFDADGNVAGSARNNVDKTNRSGTFSFPALTFDTVGTYQYTVREHNDGKGGVTYDATIYAVTITVTDDGSGQLEASVSYKSEGGTSSEQKADEIKFSNIYQATGELILPVSKKIDGRDWEFGDSFTFALYDKNPTEATGPISIRTLEIKATEGIGEGVEILVDYFDLISYNAAGEYTYYVVETGIDEDYEDKYILLDKTMYEVKVNVTDNGQGRLDTSDVSYTAINGTTSTEATEIAFVNIYTPTTVTLSGTKDLTGRDLNAGEFNFVLKDAEGNVIETVSNDGENFSFTPIEYTEAGSYSYTVSEVKGFLDGIVYDETIYSVKVEVVSGDNGKLNATVSYSVGEDTKDKIVFKNTYYEPTQFTFTKVASEDENVILAGAEFVLYKSTCTEAEHNHTGLIVDTDDSGCWTVHQKVTSGDDGTVTFNLYYGENLSYRLVETKAPLGRVLPKGQWDITVVLDDTTNSAKVSTITAIGDASQTPAFSGTIAAGDLKLSNMKPIDIPSSGGVGTFWFMIGGCLLMIGGVAVALFYQEMRRSKRANTVCGR